MCANFIFCCSIPLMSVQMNIYDVYWKIQCTKDLAQLFHNQKIFQINRIYFEEGNEQQTLQEMRNKVTKLIAWLNLNVDANAHQDYYHKVSIHCVYAKGIWKPKQ